jgi:hypothetical protein
MSLAKHKSLRSTLLAVFVSAAAVTAAHAATNPYAAIPNQWDVNHYTANSPIEVYISGSTAVDTSLINVMAGNGSNLGLCASYTTTVNGVPNTKISTLSVYYNGTASAFTQRLFVCEANPTTTGLATGTTIAVYKESTVGSGNGIQPLINIATGQASTLNFFIGSGLESAGGDSACTGTANDADGGGLNPGSSLVLPYNQFVDCPNDSTTVSSTNNHEVTGGVADVEARMLHTASGGTISATAAGEYLNSGPGLDVVWGVPVTKNLYYELQHKEGIIGTAACPGNVSSADSTTGNDTPACAPSLSKEQIAGLYTGQISSWSQLGITNPKGDETVYLCRRDKGSGTEASFDAYFLGERCSQSSLTMQPENASTVWANPSQGHILSCMQAFYSGGSLTAYYSSGTAREPGNQYAIGIASTEITPNQLTSVNDAIRFVAVDGVLPTLANTINGFWPYFSTDALYTIKPGQTGANYPSSASVSLFSKIQGFIGHPTFTAANDSTFESGYWGQGGDLAPAPLFAASNPPTLPADQTTALANPVNAYTKASSGVVDNCDTPVLDALDLPASAISAPETQILGTGTVNTTN